MNKEHETMSKEEDIEAKIAQGTGPRVTIEDIESHISCCDYMRYPGTNATICNITLDNGYTVRAESCSVSDENYNQEVGEHYSRKAVIDKLWPLYGFLLAEDLYRVNIL